MVNKIPRNLIVIISMVVLSALLLSSCTTKTSSSGSRHEKSMHSQTVTVIKKRRIQKPKSEKKIIIASKIGHKPAKIIKSRAKILKSPFECLKKAYPDFIKDYNENLVIFNDGTKLDNRVEIKGKSFKYLLNNSDLNIQMYLCYKTKLPVGKINKNFDPGRFRSAKFFEKMYGNSKKEVQKHLKKVVWMRSVFNQKLYVTTINGVDKKLRLISKELEKLPRRFHKYLKSSGTFNYRKIAGTNRKSAHSYGIAIDLNDKFSNYWRWSGNPPKYKNRIPYEIVKIFEKHGFIWGGRWYHFDTMHFEYRPELLIGGCKCKDSF